MIKRVPPSSDPALDLAVLPDSHPAVPAVVQEELVRLPSEQPPVITTPQCPSVSSESAAALQPASDFPRTRNRRVTRKPDRYGNLVPH
ncbi:hypothetical protein JTE90_019640 [Oedothorax gibbosus]|uniref:Uncharacterized protein n=1 Tax=Oedothorax gibbosus TaxID=931172 RepID=A0AAV6TM15_9ARAC|nr:hypothetical protein JTE90_019640 [Oedothorax gibbosus]